MHLIYAKQIETPKTTKKYNFSHRTPYLVFRIHNSRMIRKGVRHVLRLTRDTSLEDHSFG